MMHYILPISMLLIGLAVTRTLQAVIPDWANYRCQLCCHLWGLSVSGLWGQTFYVYLWGQTLLFVFTNGDIRLIQLAWLCEARPVIRVSLPCRIMWGSKDGNRCQDP